jgi:hypothetical protein
MALMLIVAGSALKRNGLRSQYERPCGVQNIQGAVQN